MLILEREQDALARGARIYGEISGFGQTCDAHHMSAPRPDGSCVARAMHEALQEAELDVSEIDVINAHASATPLGDVAETLAISAVLGDRVQTVPVIATKGQHAHALGASGVWEIAVTLCAMRDGVLPRIINCIEAEPLSQLALVHTQRKATIRHALTNSSGFGGINSALALSAYS